MNAKSPKNNQKHTPGPWSANPGGSSDSHYMVFKADGNYLTLDDEEHESNARLIAAAPELLEALQALLVEAECLRKAYTQHLPSEWENPDSAFAQARAIIAKATQA